MSRLRIGTDLRIRRDAAWLAEKFETSRRREDLTFKHHAEVAALPPDEADAPLDWCERAPNGKPLAHNERDNLTVSRNL